MRFVNFHDPKLDSITIGLVNRGQVIVLAELLGWQPNSETLHAMQETEESSTSDFAALVDAIDENSVSQVFNWLEELQRVDERELARARAYPLEEVTLYPPVYPPASYRDFYAFEQHVKAGWARRGAPVPQEWYEFPVFYFGNHQAVLAHDDELVAPHYGQWLDFELEIAAVVGIECRDLDPRSAEAAIAGYTVLNDWSLRDVQAREVKVGLGPAKGKDFGISLGPYLCTLSSLERYRAGKGYSLKMTAKVNGIEVGQGNWQDIHWSFGEMLSFASLGTTLYPGDVIGSGTVGGGCILELGPEAIAAKLGRENGWLQPGDVVELEVERLGVLRNTIVAQSSEAESTEQPA